MLWIRTIFDQVWIWLLKMSGSVSDFWKGPDPDPTFQNILVRGLKKSIFPPKKIIEEIWSKNFLGQNPATDPGVFKSRFRIRSKIVRIRIDSRRNFAEKLFRSESGNGSGTWSLTGSGSGTGSWNGTKTESRTGSGCFQMSDLDPDVLKSRIRSKIVWIRVDSALCYIAGSCDSALCYVHSAVTINS
jgi:hypothetical protein